MVNSAAIRLHGALVINVGTLLKAPSDVINVSVISDDGFFGFGKGGALNEFIAFASEVDNDPSDHLTHTPFEDKTIHINSSNSLESKLEKLMNNGIEARKELLRISKDN